MWVHKSGPSWGSEGCLTVEFRVQCRTSPETRNGRSSPGSVFSMNFLFSGFLPLIVILPSIPTQAAHYLILGPPYWGSTVTRHLCGWTARCTRTQTHTLAFGESLFVTTSSALHKLCAPLEGICEYVADVGAVSGCNAGPHSFAFVSA
jgi:hypothetical protein